MKSHRKTILESIFFFYCVIFKEHNGNFQPCSWAFVVNDFQSNKTAHCIALLSKP